VIKANEIRSNYLLGLLGLLGLLVLLLLFFDLDDRL
jgi:hypothetical protein